jgi:porphobilinogen synthase
LKHVKMEIMMIRRPRRNRKSSALRTLTQETRLVPSDLIVPLFVIEGYKVREPISSMPGVNRYSIDYLVEEVKASYRLGIRAVLLFPVVPAERKDAKGTEGVRKGNLLQAAVRAIKSEVPEICVMTDVALDPYTDHGHDGIVSNSGEVLNDDTLEVLGEMALVHAEAGADVVAPSDMMDGRVLYIRDLLDKNGHQNVNILSYTAKYASALYGPFREALFSAPKFGDKKTYQMNPANVREALLEGALDEAEGADMLLVKPALPYLDVLTKIRERTTLPLGAYHVSGEYSMVMAAAEKGWLDANSVMYENILSIKRAGADYIFTYGAKQVLEYMSNEAFSNAAQPIPCG